VGYRLWPRADLAHGIRPGHRSFHKLLGLSRGPGSRGRVSPRLCRPPPFGARWGLPPPVREMEVSLGCGPKPHLACVPRGRHTPLPLGGVTCVIAAPPPAHTEGDRVIRGQGVSPTAPIWRTARGQWKGGSPTCGLRGSSLNASHMTRRAWPSLRLVIMRFPAMGDPLNAIFSLQQTCEIFLSTLAWTGEVTHLL